MSTPEQVDALVIGAGPAGLMAAEVMGRGGLRVVIADQMPSPARKFLMAGKSGLNLTHSGTPEQIMAAYPQMPEALARALGDFGADAVQAWARGLGQELFTGSSGRVFPTAMKASPLLRAWLGRLADQGAQLRLRWRWLGWDGGLPHFDTPEGPRALAPRVTVLALGGASWARLGSDGRWTRHLGPCAPFTASNAGLRIDWSPPMARHFGQPLKNIALSAAAVTSRGEAVISARGLEGGGVYTLSPALRAGAPLRIDLAPDLGLPALQARLARPRGKASLANHLRKTLRWPPVKIALLQEFGRPLPDDLAPLIKALPITGARLAPLDEAISTAGGLCFDALDAQLMLHDRPGVFAAGEMLDWDAPTGGYLLTACLATGARAGAGALRYSAAAA